MTTRLIMRVMDAENHLLAWTECEALARGDGQLWAEYAVMADVERQGIAVMLSIHWADVNVEARRALPPMAVYVRERLLLMPPGPVFTVGPQAGGLPPVTIRHPVVVSVPTGVMSAVGNR